MPSKTRYIFFLQKCPCITQTGRNGEIIEHNGSNAAFWEIHRRNGLSLFMCGALAVDLETGQVLQDDLDKYTHKRPGWVENPLQRALYLANYLKEGTQP